MTNYEFFRNKHSISKKISSGKMFGYCKHCKSDEKWEIIKGFCGKLIQKIDILITVLPLNKKVILDKHLQISLDILQKRFCSFN